MIELGVRIALYVKTNDSVFLTYGFANTLNKKKSPLKGVYDAQGNYEFPKVELGKYYITTVVEWYVGNEQQGGVVNKIINVQEGHNKVMLTE